LNVRAWKLFLVGWVLTASIVAAAPTQDSPVFVLKWGSLGSAPGQFRNPDQIASDASGNIYVADVGNNRIQKFSDNGTFITMWGSPTIGSGPGEFTYPLTFPPTLAQITMPASAG
jgi:DNA-binding beta-propeller fold protein YncE